MTLHFGGFPLYSGRVEECCLPAGNLFLADSLLAPITLDDVEPRRALAATKIYQR
jgi:hypothetical protein